MIDVDPTAPCSGTATTRLWTTQAYGGMGAWIYDASNRFHTVIGFATAGNRAANLSTTKQYNAFHIAVATSNTVHVVPDPDNGIEEVISCAGCTEGMSLILNQIGLYGSAAEDQVYLPMIGCSSCIEYQGGSGACCPGAVRNTTWGELKGLYR